MTRQASSARPQGRHAGLTRRAVLDAAVTLVDRDGLEGLSMRRLGAELGVEAMTLYHHVGSKAALLDGLVERVFEDIAPEWPEDADWQESLRTFAHSLRSQLLAHPNLVPVVATRPAITPTTLRLLERGVALLQPAGFAPAESLDIVWAVVGLVLGNASTEASGGPAESSRIAQLSVSDLNDVPLLRRAVEEASGTKRPTTFDLSLDVMVVGIALRARA